MTKSSGTNNLTTWQSVFYFILNKGNYIFWPSCILISPETLLYKENLLDPNFAETCSNCWYNLCANRLRVKLYVCRNSYTSTKGASALILYYHCKKKDCTKQFINKTTTTIKTKKERKATLAYYKLGFKPSTIPEYCQIHVTIWFVIVSWRKTHWLFQVDFTFTKSYILYKIIKIKWK